MPSGQKLAALGLGGVFKPRGAVKPPMRPVKPTMNAATETYVPGKTEALTGSTGCSEGHAATMEHIQKKWPQLFGFLTQGAPVKTASPMLAKYLNADGSPNFQSLVAAPDTDLQQGVKLLTPQQRAAMKARLAAFQPNFAQRLGASAMGIDIEGQRARFGKLLA